MDNNLKKKTCIFIFEVIVITILIVMVSIFKDGVYLFEIPSISEISKVTISYPNVSAEVKEVTDLKDIELSLSLTGFLKYSFFEKAKTYEQPLVTMTYHLNNDEEIQISANYETVWWKGKVHKIKESDEFINLIEILFFLTEINEH